MFRIFQPHYRLESVLQLTPDWLSEKSISSLLLDVDSTLKAYRAETLSPEVQNWLEQMKEHQIGLCLVSNGSRNRICKIAESLHLSYIAPAMKPFPFGCQKAVRMMNFDPKRTAMVGDQLFADIPSAKLAGLISIHVVAIRPDQEPFWTRIKRPLERLFNK
ncbi:MAG: YqeG family HAD IIIA-type phosphatase [Thermoguttaceae bacterium]